MSKILKLSAAQFKALEAFTKANEEGDTVEKAAAQIEVKNLIAKSDLAKSEKGIAGEKTISQKFFEDLAMGRKGINEASLTQGGSLVPVEASSEVIMALPQFGFAFTKCATRRMKANSMRVTSVGSGVSVSWVLEQGAGTETVIPFNPIILTTGKVITLGLISNEEIEDAVVDVAELVKNVLAAAIAKDADRVIFLGQSGVFAGLKTLGGVNVVTVAAIAADGVIADALIDLQMAVPAYAINRGVYVTGIAGWAKMRKLKGSDGQYIARATSALVDGNNPQSGNTFTPVGTFDFKNVYVVEGLDTFVAANVPVYFGDFSYFVVGIKDEMSALTSKEGTVGSGATQISLLSTDQTAVRLTARLAFGNVPAAFSRLLLS